MIMRTLIKKNQGIGLLILLFGGIGCSSKSEQKRDLPLPQDSAGVTGTINTPSSFAIEKIENVKVYMENSASMKGYNVDDCKGFTSVVSELVGVYGRSQTMGYFYSDKLDGGHSAKEFSDMIAEKTVKYGKSSILDVICDSIISNNESISFLITDGIMSGPDEKVTGTKYNIEYAPELQKNLENVIKMKGRNYAISVYQFTSNFEDVYYCYDNKRIRLKKTIRPFYVIAIGKKNCVTDFYNKVKSGLEYFKPVNQIHFGIFEYPCKVLFSAGPLAEVKDTIFYVDVSRVRKNNKQFELSTCLDMLPDYMCTDSYIKQNSKLTYNSIVQSNDSLMFNLRSNTLRIKLSLLNLQKKGELLYILSYAYPQWCKSSSCLDDHEIQKDLFPTTFNLEYLIRAFHNGIESEANVIEVKYNIIKKQ